MHDIKKIKHHINITDHLLNYQQPHKHIHLKEKKQELYYTNSKLIENLTIKSLTSCLPNQNDCPVEVSATDI